MGFDLMKWCNENQNICLFILVLIVGVISGTYSSIAIATQILVIWDNRRN